MSSLVTIQETRYTVGPERTGVEQYLIHRHMISREGAKTNPSKLDTLLATFRSGGINRRNSTVGVSSSALIIMSLRLATHSRSAV